MRLWEALTRELTEKCWYLIAREDTREEPYALFVRRKKRRDVRLMGSSWIVIPFFFVPGSQLVPSPHSRFRFTAASWERIFGDYLDDNTQWTTAEKLKQFESPCCLLPIASSVTNWLGGTGVCVVNSRQDLPILSLVLLVLFRGSPLPRFGTTQPHAHGYACT